MSERLENSINNEQSLNPCNTKSPLINKLNFDKIPNNCGAWWDKCDPQEASLRKATGNPWGAWTEETCQKIGLGHHAQCDPVMTGQIVNDVPPNPRMAYRYSQALRGADEAMMDLFRNVIVIDESGKQHTVPIIWATQEKAVAFILQDNTRKDNTLVVDRIRLPLLAIHANDTQLAQDRFTFSNCRRVGRRDDGHPSFTIDEKFERDTVFGVSRGIPVDIGYTLYIWTLYLEDMNQILEQILLKFNPVAYINVRGVWWEVIVRLDSLGNNIENEAGDQAIRVIKYQINMTAQSYIPQPISRKKAVLKINEEIVNNIEEESITEILDRIQIAVKELE